MKLLTPERLDRLQERNARRIKKTAIEDGLRAFEMERIVEAKRMKREEDALQRQQVQYLRILESQGRLLFFAVPNGGKRSKIEAAIMKGLGVRAGVPDLVILWNRTNDNSVINPGRIGFIENKRQNNGRLSPHQAHWLSALNRQLHHTAIVRTFEEFLQTLGHWDILSDKETQ